MARWEAGLIITIGIGLGLAIAATGARRGDRCRSPKGARGVVAATSNGWLDRRNSPIPVLVVCGGDLSRLYRPESP
jgi:hypothetical protein